MALRRFVGSSVSGPGWPPPALLLLWLLRTTVCGVHSPAGVVGNTTKQHETVEESPPLAQVSIALTAPGITNNTPSSVTILPVVSPAATQPKAAMAMIQKEQGNAVASAASRGTVPSPAPSAPPTIPGWLVRVQSNALGLATPTQPGPSPQSVAIATQPAPEASAYERRPRQQLRRSGSGAGRGANVTDTEGDDGEPRLLREWRLRRGGKMAAAQVAEGYRDVRRRPLRESRFNADAGAWRSFGGTWDGGRRGGRADAYGREGEQGRRVQRRGRRGRVHEMRDEARREERRRGRAFQTAARAVAPPAEIAAPSETERRDMGGYNASLQRRLRRARRRRRRPSWRSNVPRHETRRPQRNVGSDPRVLARQGSRGWSMDAVQSQPTRQRRWRQSSQDSELLPSASPGSAGSPPAYLSGAPVVGNIPPTGGGDHIEHLAKVGRKAGRLNKESQLLRHKVSWTMKEAERLVRDFNRASQATSVAEKERLRAELVAKRAQVLGEEVKKLQGETVAIQGREASMRANMLKSLSEKQTRAPFEPLPQEGGAADARAPEGQVLYGSERRRPRQDDISQPMDTNPNSGSPQAYGALTQVSAKALSAVLGVPREGSRAADPAKARGMEMTDVDSKASKKKVLEPDGASTRSKNTTAKEPIGARAPTEKAAVPMSEASADALAAVLGARRNRTHTAEMKVDPWSAAAGIEVAAAVKTQRGRASATRPSRPADRDVTMKSAREALERTARVVAQAAEKAPGKRDEVEKAMHAVRRASKALSSASVDADLVSLGQRKGENSSVVNTSALRALMAKAADLRHSMRTVMQDNAGNMTVADNVTRSASVADNGTFLATAANNRKVSTASPLTASMLVTATTVKSSSQQHSLPAEAWSARVPASNETATLPVVTPMTLASVAPAPGLATGAVMGIEQVAVPAKAVGVAVSPQAADVSDVARMAQAPRPESAAAIQAAASTGIFAEDEVMRQAGLLRAAAAGLVKKAEENLKSAEMTTEELKREAGEAKGLPSGTPFGEASLSSSEDVQALQAVKKAEEAVLSSKPAASRAISDIAREAKDVESRAMRALSLPETNQAHDGALPVSLSSEAASVSSDTGPKGKHAVPRFDVTQAPNDSDYEEEKDELRSEAPDVSDYEEEKDALRSEAVTALKQAEAALDLNSAEE